MCGVYTVYILLSILAHNLWKFGEEAILHRHENYRQTHKMDYMLFANVI